jgi:hypothetical protein
MIFSMAFEMFFKILKDPYIIIFKKILHFLIKVKVPRNREKRKDFRLIKILIIYVKEGSFLLTPI